MSDLQSMSEAVNGEDPWTDEAFASPLADVSEQAAHPGDRALQWSLASMVLVLTAVIVPVLGALPPLLAVCHLCYRPMFRHPNLSHRR